MTTATIDRYAVIGNPIAQSKSPLIHGSFAQSTGQTLEYTKLEGPTSPPGAFEQMVRDFAARGGKGMNVTAPFKLLAYDMADVRSDRAQCAGAANALKFEGGRITAENFDGLGLVNDIQHNLGVALAGKRILLLGAGGAARGALDILLAQRPLELVIANRTAATAQALALPYAGHAPVRGGDFNAIGGLGSVGSGHFDVVVNATSASLFGEPLPLSATVFAPGALAYDLAYGKGLTPFLKLAQSAGAVQLADGVGMLVEQAAEAFAWWRGVRPATGPVIQMMSIPLS